MNVYRIAATITVMVVRLVRWCVPRATPPAGRGRILAVIGHPAQVHKMRNLFSMLEERGYHVSIAAVDKEMTYRLLDEYGLAFHPVGAFRKGMIRKYLEMWRIDLRLYRLARSIDPDILIGVGSVYAAHVGHWVNRPVISFEDMENMEQIWMYEPFTAAVVTPRGSRLDLGAKQVRVNSYYPLAYLKDYTPAPRKIKEPYVVWRFIDWGATHDRNAYSEIFDLLYHSELFVGESLSMVAEAAMLGKNAILVTTLEAGTYEDMYEHGLFKKAADFIEPLEDMNEAMLEVIERELGRRG